MLGTRQIRRRPVLGAVALVASLLAAVPLASTFADLQTVDGDLVAPGIQRTVARAVAPAGAVTVTARLQVNFQNPSHVAPGSTVHFVVDPATTTLPAGFQVGDATVSIPSVWKGGSVAAATTTTAITFTGASTKGTRTYQVGWKASPAVTGITVSRILNIRVKTSGAQPPPPDTTPPVLTLPTPGVGAAVGPDGAVVTFTVAAVDAVDGPTEVECDHEGGSGFPIGTTLVTCTSSDDSGNVATGSFNVTVLDQVAPVFQPMAPITVAAVGPGGATVDFTLPRAVDSVDGPLPVTCDPPSGSQFALGTTPVTCTATDTHGNQAQTVITIVITDTDAPVLAVPGDLTVEAIGPSGASVAYTTTAADAVDGAVTPACNPVSGAPFALGTTTVTCTATDGSGNTASASFGVLVHDTAAPAVTTPEHVVVEAAGPAGAPATFAASATDLVSGIVTATCTSQSGSTFGLGTTTVTCAATDAAGNTGTASFVVQVLDTTAPVLTLPDHLEGIEATDGSGAIVSFDATAVDAVDGSLTTSCSEVAGEAFPVGTTVVTCDAVDAAGNASSGSFSVTVTDTTAPTLSLPGPVTAEATGPGGAAVDVSATAFDAVSGLVAVSCDAGSVLPLGATTVTCTATDDNGNTSIGSFTVTVVDTTAPELTLPAVGHIEATGPSGAHVTYAGATATDLVDPTVTATCTPASGTTFAIGDTTVTCTATDAADNAVTAAFVVTVSDSTAPDLVVPESVTAEATGPDGAVVTYPVTAADAVSGSVLPVTCDHPSGATVALGATTVTCTVVDAAGNERTASFMVSVVDTSAPDLTVPSDILDVEATGPAGAAITYATSATDAVDGTVTVSCSAVSGATFALGDTVVTCTASDGLGHEATASFTVNVTDTTAPQLQLPTGTTVEADGPAGSQVTFEATATDVVDGGVLTSCAPASTTVFAVGETTVACSATDAAGNVASGSFVVHVVDHTGPQLGLPGDTTLEATGAYGAAVAYSATANDAVDGSLAVTCSLPPGGTAPLGATSVSCSSTDAAGNTATGTFQVTVLDTTSPSVTPPGSITIGAVGPTGAIVTYPAASASDAVTGSLPVTCDPSSGALFALGATTVTCTATDGQGNVGQTTFVVTVSDHDAPVLTVPPALLVEATSGAGATATFSASASDVVDGSVATTCTPSSGTAFAYQVATTVGCSATDAAGNVGTGTFVVTVVDSTPPVLTLPAPIIIEATGPGTPVSYAASAVDIVSGAITPNCSKSSGALFTVGSTVVSCSAQDTQGNSVSGSFVVLVTDTVAPTFTPPANVTTQAANGAGAVVTFAAGTALDVVSGSVPVLCTPASGTRFPVGSTVVTCSATDGQGNARTAAFTVTVTPAPPSAPTAAVATPGSASLTVAFGTPIDDGGAPITSYQVTCTTGAQTGTATGSGPPITVTGLTPGASYSCTVRAQNAAGWGPTSTASSTAMPWHVPLWVGFGFAGEVATSPDGTTWTSASVPPNPGGTRAVAASNTRYVIIANAGAILSSGDGATWTLITVPGVGDFQDVTYGAGSFVAVGSTGKIARSTDGVTWTVAGYTATAAMTDVQYALGRFVVTVATSDTTSGIVSSTDGGVTWTPGTGAAGFRAHTVAYGNGRWWSGGCLFPCSNATYYRAATSTDGSSWSLVTTNSRLLRYNMSYGGGRFMVGSDTVDPFTVADGGLAWSGPAGVSTNARFSYGNGLWVATTQNAVVKRSVDGATWTAFNVPGITRPTPPGYGAGKFVTASGQGATVNRVSTSTDGAAWTFYPSPMVGLTPRYFAATVPDTVAPTLALPTTVTAPALNAAGAYVTYAASATDLEAGSVPVSCAPASGAAFHVGSMTVTCSATDPGGNVATGTFTVAVSPAAPSNGTQWVGWGFAGGVAISSDGATWLPATAPTNAASARAAASSGARYVIVGDATLLLTSGDDGATWTQTSSPFTGNIVDVTHAAGKFVAVGAGGQIASSVDGVTWTAASYSGPVNIADIEYADGRFVVTGYTADGLAGGIATSTDGLTWTNVPGTAAFVGNKVAWGNGRWWATGCCLGSNGTAATSTDGITWSILSTGGKHLRNSLVYGGGRFLSGFVGTAGVATVADGDLVWSGPYGSETNAKSVYGNGTWIAVGAGAGASRSTDGTTWTYVPYGSGFNRGTPADYGAGSFVVGGWFTAQVATSPDGVAWTTHPAPMAGLTAHYVTP